MVVSVSEQNEDQLHPVDSDFLILQNLMDALALSRKYAVLFRLTCDGTVI